MTNSLFEFDEDDVSNLCLYHYCGKKLSILTRGPMYPDEPWQTRVVGFMCPVHGKVYSGKHIYVGPPTEKETARMSRLDEVQASLENLQKRLASVRGELTEMDNKIDCTLLELEDIQKDIES